MNLPRATFFFVSGSALCAMAACGSCSSSNSSAADAGSDAAEESGSPLDATTDGAEDAGADSTPGLDQAAPDSESTRDASASTDASPTDATAPTDAITVVDAAAASDASADGPVACVQGDGGAGVLCSGAGCVDTTSDPGNCGGCGAMGFGCEAGALCSASHCVNVAGNLAGLRWELPCSSTSHGTSCATDVDGSVEEVLTTTLSGATGTTYLVTLHFRGIVEQRTYSGFDAGGAVGAEIDGGSNPGYFIAGATTPSTGDTFNIYELDISSPPQTYYLNSGSSGINYVWLIDYLATIPMAAGATVTLTANSVEGQEIANQGPDGGPVFVAGVPPFPDSFNGQFVQMDVISVVASP